MLKKWLSRINLGLGSLSVLFVLLALLFFLTQPQEIAIADIPDVKRAPPKNSFEMKKEVCDTIGKTCLELKFIPLSQQLPDLRNYLIYHGRNGRPDANESRTTLHFAFVGNVSVSSAIPGEKLYLTFDRTKTPNQYVFSPQNVPTSLWIEAAVLGNDALVTVRMKNEQGDIITEPQAYAEIRLSEKDGHARAAGKNWEMGKWRVDGSLLVRQKASWKGIDLFLEHHGGEEFKSYKGKHRIEFNHEEPADPYSVYVALNDNLIWKDNRWKVVEPGENSLKYPLMVVKKVDERILSFELWDVDGKGKIGLNLVKAHEPWANQLIQKSFECLGVRTRSQYIFEIDKERVLLSPQDWLLKTEEGWVKLVTPQEIDQYVERKKVGLLFILKDAVAKEGHQILTGVVYNSNRTEMQEIEIPIQKVATSTASHKQKIVAENDEDEDNFDDDDDDDDED